MVDSDPADEGVRTSGPSEVVGADVEDTGQATLARRLAAEFVGTLLLVAAGAGAATVLVAGPPQALGGLREFIGGVPGQEELFGTLLGNSLADTLGVAFAFATVLAVIVYAFGGVSGGHFNPAVTFALALARRFTWNEVLPYWVLQIAGGLAGAFVIAGIYGQNGASVGGVDVLFGGTTVADDLNIFQAILAEAFITFVLMSAIMAVAVDPRAPKGWSGIVIGIALGTGILATAAATGGSANFARSLGPFIASLAYDTRDIPWGDLIAYAVGPVIGAAAAALVYESVSGLEKIAPPPRPGAATPAAESGAPTE